MPISDTSGVQLRRHRTRCSLCLAVILAPVGGNPSQRHLPKKNQFRHEGAAKLKASRDAVVTAPIAEKETSTPLLHERFDSEYDAVSRAPVHPDPIKEKEISTPVLHERFDSAYDAEYTLSGDGGLIDDFLRDTSLVQETLNTALTTPDHRFTKFPCDSSYSKIWTNADWDKHCEGPLIRYKRHAFTWPASTTAKTVMPISCLTGIYALTVCILSAWFPRMLAILKMASVNNSGLLGSFAASPIALLLTLRTNRALDRLVDAKKNWGLMKRSVRSFAGLICAYVGPTNRQVCLLACRYLVLLPWSLKGFLREQADDIVIRTILPAEEAEWLLSAPAERPIAILGRLRNLVLEAGAGNDRSTPVCATAHQQMCERLYDLETVVGTSKRLLGSPIAPTFTRHTSRLLCLYLGLLPLSLLGSGVVPPVVVLTTLLTSYILVGIDEIGLKIERPFPFIPMHALCMVSQRNVMDQVVLVRDMPKVSD